jgi:hypothetical protein
MDIYQLYLEVTSWLQPGVLSIFYLPFLKSWESKIKQNQDKEQQKTPQTATQGTS